MPKSLSAGLVEGTDPRASRRGCLKDLESQPSEGLAEEAWKPTNLRRWSFAFQAPSNTIQTPFNHLLSTIQAPPAYLAWPRCTSSTHPPSSTFEAFCKYHSSFHTHHSSTIQAPPKVLQHPVSHVEGLGKCSRRVCSERLEWTKALQGF